MKNQVNKAIADIKAIAAGRPRYEGSPPWADELLIAEIERLRVAQNEVALWMMGHGYATGHGDTIGDMLAEMEAQAHERCAKIAERLSDCSGRFIAEAIRDPNTKVTG